VSVPPPEKTQLHGGMKLHLRRPDRGPTLDRKFHKISNTFIKMCSAITNDTKMFCLHHCVNETKSKEEDAEV